MRQSIFAIATLASVLALGQNAKAASVSLMITGPGVSGSITLTYGTDPVTGDPPGASAITGASGTFSDSNANYYNNAQTLSITNESITGVYGITTSPPPGAYNPANPPASLSFVNVLNSPPGDTGISYDDLFYPDGSPYACPGFAAGGGYFDVYGVMFELANGDLVDLWSNGVGPDQPPPLTYGAIVIDPDFPASGENAVIDVQDSGVQVPEPGSVGVFFAGLLGLLGWRHRALFNLPLLNTGSSASRRLMV